jgi:DNA-directed RNA polymerase subunit M
MKFCEKCGNLMIVEKIKGKPRYTCRKCGFVSSEKVTSRIVEKITSEEKKTIISEDEGFKQYPKTKIICPHCGNNEAYWYMQQTRAADEPPTRFYWCTRCGYSWREY